MLTRLDLPEGVFQRVVELSNNDVLVSLILRKLFNLIDLKSNEEKLKVCYKNIQYFTESNKRVPAIYSLERLNIEIDIEKENLRSAQIDEELLRYTDKLSKEDNKKLDKLISDFKLLI